MAWLPLDPALLRIGLHIKIDHSWMEHPFIRNVFTVSSPTEIAVIQKHRLTKLFYDPDRSHADVVAAMADPATVAEPLVIDAQMVEDVEADEKAMRKEKAIHIQHAIEHRKVVEDIAEDYTRSTHEASVMIAMANAGQRESVHSASKIISSMIALSRQEMAALSLVCAADPADPGHELAMHAMNVAALVFLAAKTLRLDQEETEHVGMGALFHNIGLNRVSLAIRAKTGSLLPAEQKLVQMHPQFSKEILQGLPDVPSEVTEIVYQHREWLDGTGYPRRLCNGDISKLARLLGTVVEYDRLTSDRQSERTLGPSHALSHLYANMQKKYGSDVIDPFIATVTVFPPGSFVELNDNGFGLVMKTNEKERLRPLIMLYDRDASHSQAAIVDLARERSLAITRSLDPKSIPARMKETLLPGTFNGYAISAS